MRSIVAELRERTARAHAALEASDFVMPATRDRAAYAQLVAAMLAFHRAIEREFRRFEHELRARGLEMSDRYKSHLLEAECRAFGALRRAEPMLTFASACEAAGAVYVLEGSTLGGTLIAKSVAAHLATVSRYYGCYGAETAERWRRTKDALEQCCATSEDRDAMCRGAEATFEALRTHLALARSG